MPVFTRAILHEIELWRVAIECMPKFRLLPQAKMATFPLSTAYQNLISLTNVCYFSRNSSRKSQKMLDLSGFFRTKSAEN